jgi:hypothetical protein
MATRGALGEPQDRRKSLACDYFAAYLENEIKASRTRIQGFDSQSLVLLGAWFSRANRIAAWSGPCPPIEYERAAATMMSLAVTYLALGEKLKDITQS